MPSGSFWNRISTALAILMTPGRAACWRSGTRPPSTQSARPHATARDRRVPVSVRARSPRVRLVATAAVLLLWTVVALGGLAGTIAHVIGPVPGHGPMDLRPRPIAAPLVFTLLGSVGAAALTLGQRARRAANKS